MKKSLLCAAGVLLASTLFAGNTRIAVSVPALSLVATTTVTTAMLGSGVKYAEITGVSYVTTAGSLPAVTSTPTIVTASTNSIASFATVGVSSNDATVAATGCPVVGLNEKVLVTQNVTNGVATTTIFHLRTSTPQGVMY
jgi:hypothetical protein